MYGSHQMFNQAPRQPVFPFSIAGRGISRGGYNNRFYRRPHIFMDGQQPSPMLSPAAAFQVAVAHPVLSEMFPGATPAERHVPATASMAADATCDASGVSSCENGPGGVECADADPVLSNDPGEQLNMANMKEKTPMCLINELARFNKIQHQYTLTDEQGPAHKKVFYVKLKLGDEEFAATGQSIKKAQHAAAKIALEQTKYRKPPPKSHRPGSNSLDVAPENPSITPTVELNALAMKRAESASYHPIERPRPVYYPMAAYDFRGMYNQRYSYPRPPNRFCILLKVGSREFIGEGNTLQAARHQAASLALKTLRELPLPQSASKPKTKDSPEPVDDTDAENKDVLKSVISLVHEVALKRNLSVNFEVTKEFGLPHLRNFITRCTCGHLTVDGEGKSKKLSKKMAAEKMMDELLKLSPLPLPPTDKPKRPFAKPKQNKTLIKLQKANPDYGAGINPISRLIQIQQAKKEKEPLYTLVSERGAQKQHEFVIQVMVGEKLCSGSGPNKKLAKRNAAEQMLQLLGYSRPNRQPSKPAIKAIEGNNVIPGVGSDKKVTFVDQDQTQNQVRQLVPGVIVVPVKTLSNFGQNGSYQKDDASLGQTRMEFSKETTATIVSEVLNTGSSSTAEMMIKSGMSTTTTGPSEVSPLIAQSPIRPKAQLLYLAQILGFQVQFTDFPKGGNKEEYLSLVTLSTNPPQHSHGSGPTVESANDCAALESLRTLAELGLNGMGCNTTPGECGDGPRRSVNSGTVKSELSESTYST